MLTITGATLNYAYIDASWQEQPEGSGLGHLGLGGWGLVLLLPGYLPLRLQGQMLAPDNNAAELQAVQQALQVAPAGQPLTVYTDNQAVLACIQRGRGPLLLGELTAQIHAQAQARQVALQARTVRRTARHLQAAHELANQARRGQMVRPEQTHPLQTLPLQTLPLQTEVVLEQKAGAQGASLRLRRAGAYGLAERVTAHLTPNPNLSTPPSVQLLLAAVQLARPGECLLIRRASKLAQAMWQNPQRALRPEVQQALWLAQQTAQQRGVQVVFEGATTQPGGMILLDAPE